MIGAGRALYILVIVSLVVGLCSPVFAVGMVGVAVNSVSVSPTNAKPGDTISISVKAQYDWEEYTVTIVFPDGSKAFVGDGRGSDTYSWTVPSYAPPGTYTVEVDSKYYDDKSTTFTVVRSSGGSGGSNALPDEEVPEPVKNFFNRLLTLVMYIAWSVVIIAGVAAGIMFLLGKEAPQFLGRVLVAAFILSVIITVIWWLAGR